MERNIILASQSPRRRQLLDKMGVDFTIVPSDFDEYFDESRDCREVAIELALGKARAVAKVNPDAYIIGSDTIVEIDGRQLGKPEDDDDARKMFKLLSGREHQIITSIALISESRGIELTGSESVLVKFKEYNEADVEEYIATGDHQDKAGAYGIQSGAHKLIEYIDGNFDAAVGLPTQTLSKMLTQIGIKSSPVRLDSPVNNLSVK